jgi:hypothetical protein
MRSRGNLMRQLYFIVPGAALTRRLLGELEAEGLEHHSIRVFARRPRRLSDLPVTVTGLRPHLETLLTRALTGAALALAAALLVMAFGGAAPAPGLALVAVTVAGAAAGAATAPWRAYPRKLRPLRPEVGRADVVMELQVPDGRLESVAKGVKRRHPEVRVKGTDPAGSPPFP